MQRVVQRERAERIVKVGRAKVHVQRGRHHTGLAQLHKRLQIRIVLHFQALSDASMRCKMPFHFFALLILNNI